MSDTSQSTKHTPGPWHVGGITQANLVQVFVGDGEEEYSICDLWGDVFGDNETNLTREQKANACLIAAAPELLKALEDLMMILKDVNLPTAVEGYTRATIRKAKGLQ